MEDNVKKKNNRIALIGGVLLIVLGYAILQCIGFFLGGKIEKATGIEGFSYLFNSVVMLIYLLVYHFVNRKTFEGCLKGEKIWLGIIMLLPYIIVGIGGTLLMTLLGQTELKFTWMALFMAVEAAICEEIAIRVVPVAHMMRFFEDEKNILLVCLITAICFGLIHITNVNAGMSVGYVVIQVFHAFGAGMLFCAVYLRTGSIVPAFIAHFLNDFIPMLSAGFLSGGEILTEATMPVSRYISVAVIVIVFVGLALFYIRPKKRGEIMQLWAKKWKKV